MENDDPINKIIDAKNQFRLKKINDKLAEQGGKPITIKDLLMRDRFAEFMAPLDTREESLKRSNEFRKSLGLEPMDMEQYLRALDPNAPVPKGLPPAEPSNVVQATFKPKPVDPSVVPSKPASFKSYALPKIEQEIKEAEASALKNEKIRKEIDSRLKTVDFGGDAAKLAEENAARLKASTGTDVNARSRYISGKLPIIGDKAQFEMDLQRIRDLEDEANKHSYNSLETQLYKEKADKLLQNLGKENLERASIDPNFNSNVLDLQETKMDKTFKEISEILDSLNEKTLEKTHQSLNPKNLYRGAESQIAEKSLRDLKQSNPSGRVSVDYGDFRTPLEKNIDSAAKALKLDNLKQMAMDAPKMAGKALQYAAPPLAAYDLFWNKPRESAKEIQRKGLAQELSELGLDISALAAPAARLAGKAALGAGLDMAAMPLGGYLLGKEFFPGNEPRDPNAAEMPEDEQYSPIYAPSTGLANVPGADEMPHFKDIKSLLKK